MSIHATTRCDYCQSDLSDSGPRQRYGLVLQAFKVPTTAKYQQTVLITPPIEEPHHFCGIGCLSAWAESVKGS